MYKDFVYFIIFGMKNFKIFIFVVLVMTTIVVNKGMAACDCNDSPSGQPDYCRDVCDWQPWDGGDWWTNTDPWMNPDGPNQWNSASNPSDCPDGQSYDSGWITLCCQYPLEGGSCPSCPSNRRYTINWQELCCPGVVENWECTNNLSDVWININAECLLNWQCSFNAYKAMWIRQSNENPTVLWFFQDITLTATTVALWTFVVVAMVLAWLYWAIASVTGKDTKKPKTILISCFVWILLVMWSYAIIRLIQFLATAWS